MKQFKKSRILNVLVCLSLFLLLFGCTMGTGGYISPQANFDFPNSNVIPLGHVRGEAIATSFMYPEVYSADLKEQAVQNALKQKGGDILIDIVFTWKIKAIPILPIYTTTLIAEGTACKMEIGKQELK